VEGTAGNTGIGLTLVANARGYKSVIVMPETQSREKIEFLRMIGADLRLVPAKPFRDPGNYVHVARRLAEELGAVLRQPVRQPGQPRRPPRHHGRGNLGQTGGGVDAFTCACGTGGTLAGVADALKARNPAVRIVLADPDGSGLYGWVKSGDLSVSAVRSPKASASPACQAIWKGRPLTMRYAYRDAEALEQVFGLLNEEGLSVGGSAGINVAAAIRVARDWARAIPWSPCSATAGRAIRASFSTLNFCAARACPSPPGWGMTDD
jgi:cysteine synthase A